MKALSPAPRVMLYGLGNYGLEAARILAGKGWPIVAAVNRAGPKIGQDLGTLAGIGRELGVVVQDAATTDFASLGADVAILAMTDRLRSNMPAYEQLLGAGINVVCHGAEAYFPWGSDPQSATLIDALAKRNGVTLTGTGIWDFSRIWAGIGVAGPMTRLDSIFHRTLTDAETATRDLAKVCGVSLTQEEFASANGSVIGNIYKLVPHHVVHALGYTVTNVVEDRKPILSDTPVWSRIFDRFLEPGICLGIRIVTEIETEEGLTATAHSELRILPEGETEHMFWQMIGRPATSVRVDRSDSLHMSAACLVNRVPDVMAAAPGIQLVSQLNTLMPKAPF